MRLRHIDRIRAVAVLCMVEVHTAAILPPKGMTVGDPGAFIAAAFGGMAAPLFVMISGWGIHKSAIRRSSGGPTGSPGWVNWIVPRLAVLVFCQFLVNVLLNVERGGRFEWHTPGVLTLLAFASLVAPLLVRLTIRTRASILLMMAVSPIILGDASGLGWTWWDRVSSEGSAEWIARLLWNGTYPVVPWMFYIILGTLLHDTSGNRMIRERFIAIGIGMTLISIIFSFLRGIPWALTEGNAVLTFFPASTAFLVVSGTFALLAHRILEGDEADGGDPWKGDSLSFLEPLGRVTLTVYVAHFAVLGAVALVMQGEPRLEFAPSFIATIGHTIIWIPIAILHQRHCPNICFEELLRRVSH